MEKNFTLNDPRRMCWIPHRILNTDKSSLMSLRLWCPSKSPSGGTSTSAKPIGRNLPVNLADLDPTPTNYEKFIEVMQPISKKHIPCGCREYYIPGISTDYAILYYEYLKLYNEDPFSDDTLTSGEILMAAIAEERMKSWK